MDKKKSIINVVVSISFKVITMVMVILVKRILIRTCGNEVNGLNALYLSIVGFLSVAELGVGSAITFCMYRPIVEGNNRAISALYGLFRRLYRIIGCVILVMGLAITPVIHFFAADYTALDVNLHSTFVLMLISVVITYFFGAQTSLINAYKNNYITTAITSGGVVLQYVLQIVALLITKSFFWYLVCRIVAALAQFLATEIVVRRKYRRIITHQESLDVGYRKEVTRSIKAMFMHKIGYLLVSTVDSIIISMYLGVAQLGAYSNYSTIQVSMMSLLKLLFSSLTSVLGHLYVEKNRQTARQYCEKFQLLNFFVGTVFFLGYYAVIDNLIAMLFHADLVAEKAVALVVTVNGFIQFMRTNVLTFREATGTFYHDRWKSLAEGLVNVVLSILFVRSIGVVGVILATIVTNLAICHIVEPYVLYKHGFGESPKRYWLKNYGMIALFGCALALLDGCMQVCDTPMVEFLVNGMMSVGISLPLCGAVFLLSKIRGKAEL